MKLGTEPSAVTRWIILGVVGVIFAIPIIALLQFSFRDGLGGGYTLDHWTSRPSATPCSSRS